MAESNVSNQVTGTAAASSAPNFEDTFSVASASSPPASQPLFDDPPVTVPPESMLDGVVSPSFVRLEDLPFPVRVASYRVFAECNRAEQRIVKLRADSALCSMGLGEVADREQLEVDVRAVLDTLSTSARMFYYLQRGMYRELQAMRAALQNAQRDRVEVKRMFPDLPLKERKRKRKQ